jgi:hypothetical protein
VTVRGISTWIVGGLVLALVGAEPVRAQTASGEASFAFRTLTVPDGVSLPAAQYIEHEMKINDAIAFVLSKQKPLGITKPQRDSLQKLEKAARRERQSHLTDLERRYSGPNDIVRDARAIPPDAMTRRERLLAINAEYARHAAAVLDETQLAKAAELHQSFDPPRPQPQRTRYEVKAIGSPFLE